jgi:hypothetical protein
LPDCHATIYSFGWHDSPIAAPHQNPPLAEMTRRLLHRVQSFGQRDASITMPHFLFPPAKLFIAMLPSSSSQCKLVIVA